VKTVSFALGISLMTATVGGCMPNPGVAPTQASAGYADSHRNIRFVTTEITRPYMDVSPDGRSFYFDALGEIYRVSIEGGRAIRMDLGDGWKTQPTLSREGGWIAFNRDHADSKGIWVQQLASDARFMALTDDHVRTGPVEGIDEPLHMFNGGRTHLDVQAAMNEEIVAELPALKGQIRKSRDGRWIGYARLQGGRTMLAVHDLATGKSIPTGCELDMTLDAQPFPTYAFIPGQEAVLLSRGGVFRRCDFNGGEVEIAISAEIDMALAPMLEPGARAPVRTQIRHPALAPRGNQFVFTAKGRIWKAPLGEAPTPIATGSGESLMPAYAPDGKSIAFVSEDDGTASLRILDLESGGVRVLSSSMDRAYANPAWSPDGSMISFVEVDQRNNARDPRTGGDAIRYLSLRNGHVSELGKTLATPNQTHLYQRVSWSPDSDGIYYTREKWSKGGGSVESIELLYHPLHGEPMVLLTMQPAIQAAVVSSSGKYVALQDRLGIAIIPLQHPSDNPVHVRHVTLAEVRNLPRMHVDGPDYVWWTADDQLLWSVQDEIFASREWKYGRMSPTLRMARIVLPVPKEQAPAVNVYSGGRIITMIADKVIENGAIVTVGSKIEYVGPESGIPLAFVGTPAIDLAGKTVMPGLIDVHAHRAFGLDDLATVSSHELLAEVAYGVTTVFDPQVSTIKSAYLTDLSRDDSFAGPTFYGTGTSMLGDRGNGAHAMIESPADARGYVARQVKAGAPLIKAYWRPSRRDRQWLVQAARELGVGIASDESRIMPIQLGSVQDGYTAIEHSLMFQPAPARYDVIRFMKDSGVSITPTVAIGGNVEEFLTKQTRMDMHTACLVEKPETRTSAHAGQARTSADLSEISTHARNALYESAEMLNAGVRVSIGGHGRPAGLISHWEMWALALGGATPMNVLKAATVNGAYKLGVQNRIGALAEGMDADFVILNSNPLDDIHNTVDIARVIRRGRTVQWPDGTRWPLSWPADGDWDACKAWNLGVPAEEAAPGTLH
jgi:hypothetical protein